MAALKSILRIRLPHILAKSLATLTCNQPLSERAAHRNIIRADLDRPHARGWPYPPPAEQISVIMAADRPVYSELNLMLDLDATFITDVPNCRCPPNLSARRPAATFFEAKRTQRRNVPILMRRPPACDITSNMNVRQTVTLREDQLPALCGSRWGNVQERWRRVPELCERCGDIPAEQGYEHLALPGFSAPSSCDATIFTRFNGSSAPGVFIRCSYCSNSCSSSSLQVQSRSRKNWEASSFCVAANHPRPRTGLISIELGHGPSSLSTGLAANR